MSPDRCPPVVTFLPRFRHVQDYNAMAARSRLGLMAEIVLANGVYWLRKDQQCEGPYCPNCYKQDDITIRLVSYDALRICPRCGKEIGASGRTP